MVETNPEAVETPAHEQKSESKVDYFWPFKMERADAWMVLFTAIIALTGIAGFVILRGQLIAMQGQLDEMHSSGEDTKVLIKTAQDSADIAREALVAVQRAFINVSELKQESIVGNDGSIKSWHLTPVIKNTGNTPAYNVSIVVISPLYEWILVPQQFNTQKYFKLSWKVQAPRDPDDLIGQKLGGPNFSRSNFSLGPQGTLSASSLTQDITTQNSLDAATGKIGRFIYGSIRYFDAFKAPHVSKFCFRIDGFQMRPGSFEPLQDLCAHWNCSDESCQKDKENYEADVAMALAEPAPPPAVYIDTSKEK